MASWDIGNFGRVIAVDGAYRVLVVGGASGIGLETSLFLAGCGARVTLADRDGTGAAAAVDAIVQAGGQATSLQLDVTDATQVADRLGVLVGAEGPFHAMINAAGVTGVTNIPGHLVDLTDFDRVVEINLRGALVLTQAVLPGMLAAGFGRILHVASIAGKEGNAGMAAYSASKAGLIGLVKSMAKDCATSGVTINALAPAVIQTPLVAALPDATVSYMTAKIPMARTGTLDEAARMAAFAISPACGFTTGFTFDLSGGRATY
jgi:3-oxoacyl-[acyl-carrier protein] reductase